MQGSMDLVLVVAAVVLASVLWAIVRTLQADATHSKSATAAAAPVAKAPPKPPEAVPSLVEEGDIIEITVVEAAPLSQPPPSWESGAPSQAEASLVEVIYEDEAQQEEVTLPQARILVSAQGQSDRGNVRKRNEDSLLVWPERSVFCVADGMGGHHGGDVASALAVETIHASFEQGRFDAKTRSDVDVPRRGRELACAIQMANHAIFDRARSDPSLDQMGTTVVAARFSPNKQRVYIGHVGDSRCYRFRNNVLRQLTRDHTMAELMGLKGPHGQHLFQAVGIRASIFIDVVVDKPRVNDVYLLCSDGLSKMVTDEGIRDTLVAHPALDSAVKALIDFANASGGRDNTTVVLVKVADGPAAARAARGEALR
jgi:serine/threonine protein phosphatase PrpC